MGTDKKPGILIIIVRLAILAILAVFLLFVLQNDNLRFESLPQFFTGLFGDEKETAAKLSFAPDSTNTFEPYQDGLAVLSSTGLTLIDASGEERLSLRTGYARPTMKSAGAFLIAYDVGGKGLRLVQDHMLKQNLDFTSPILTADLNADGWFLVVAEKPGSKATVSVFDSDLTQRYEWFSRERYITCAVISTDNTGIAFGGLRQEDAHIVSSVVLLHFDNSEEPYAVVDLLDVIILDMKYLADGSLAILTENSVLVLDEEGNERGRYEFDSALFKEYSFDGDDFLMLRLSKTGVGETSELILLDYDAKPVKTAVLNNILSSDCQGKFAGVLTSDHIIVYNSSLEEQSSSAISAGSKLLLMRDDGAALVLSSAEALVYR